ncbi:MAG: RNA polymerase sigma-54 factor [Deltaproteobacteria bacterium RBG_13_43_22]|nr:MAG: RNA polymerase sigma-54 factor [Deltaproteobacteria bacterium RBG_13_43_22]
MALEIKQQLKLAQQLIMTPQLQQAIKLLQLSRLELLDNLHQELEANPVLEEAVSEELESTQIEKAPGESEAEPEDRQTEVTIGEQAFEGMDWDNYVNDYYTPRSEDFLEDRDQHSYENMVSKKTSLSDHLLWQLSLSNLTPEEERVGSEIIGNLDVNGYLTASLEEISQGAQQEIPLVEKVLLRLQEFDPLGVASRDLKECLLIQARHLKSQNPWVDLIIKDHLNSLETKNYLAIARALQAPIEEIIMAVEIILQLDPKPGRLYSDEEPQYISPDIYVYKMGEEVHIVLNEDGLPRLRINAFYKKALGQRGSVSEATRDYIQEKLRSAIWLIKSIHQRQRTIYRVAESIFRFQREFLDHGVSHLKPLILRDVAEEVQMHESTISRVTTNKYVHTPQGIFELKFFFNSSVVGADGENVASESVKERIRLFVAHEDPAHPLSDQELTELLLKENIHIARRTVAKYREALKVLPSSKRKKIPIEEWIRSQKMEVFEKNKEEKKD